MHIELQHIHSLRGRLPQGTRQRAAGPCRRPHRGRFSSCPVQHCVQAVPMAHVDPSTKEAFRELGLDKIPMVRFLASASSFSHCIAAQPAGKSESACRNVSVCGSTSTHSNASFKYDTGLWTGPRSLTIPACLWWWTWVAATGALRSSLRTKIPRRTFWESRLGRQRWIEPTCVCRCHSAHFQSQACIMHAYCVGQPSQSPVAVRMRRAAFETRQLGRSCRAHVFWAL